MAFRFCFKKGLVFPFNTYIRRRCFNMQSAFALVDRLICVDHDITIANNKLTELSFTCVAVKFSLASHRRWRGKLSSRMKMIVRYCSTNIQLAFKNALSPDISRLKVVRKLFDLFWLSGQIHPPSPLLDGIKRTRNIVCQVQRQQRGCCTLDYVDRAIHSIYFRSPCK